MDDQGMIEIPTKHGNLQVHPEHFVSILDKRIGYIHFTDRREEVKSGFYSRPAVMWCAKDGLYHRFTDLHSLLRGARYTEDGEGYEVKDVEDSEYQKLVAWAAEHAYAKAIILRPDLDQATRKHYEETCSRVALEMGKPDDETKRDIQAHVLAAAMAEGPEAAQLLDETLVLDQTRMDAVASITVKYDLRIGAVVKHVVTRQQQLDGCLRRVEDLHHQHLKLVGSRWMDRTEHYKEVRTVAAELRQVVERPYRGLAWHTERDLNRYLYGAAEGNETYSAAGFHLQRAVAGQRCAQAIRELNGALYMLALAKQATKQRKKELQAKARARIEKISQMNPLDCEAMYSNPMWRVVGCANDATRQFRIGTTDWEEVKDLLKQGVAAL